METRSAAAFAPFVLLMVLLGCRAGADPEPAASSGPPGSTGYSALRSALVGRAASTEPAGSSGSAASQAAPAGDAIGLARRFAQPSNDLRLAVLEEELQRRDLPYALQTFPRAGAAGDRPAGHNVVVAFGAGPPGVIVGGHFDADRLDDGTLSQGLVDNAAGVVVLLQVAGTLRDAALQGTVHVVFFDMEELGLLGSRAYADSLEPAPGAVMVNVDIVGYGDTLLYGPGDLTPEHPLTRPVHRVCARHAVACVGTPRMPPSDDRSFRRAGIPAVSLALLPAEEAHRAWLFLNGDVSDTLRRALTPAILRTIHTERDTADRLEPEALARATRIVTDLVLDLDAAAP